MFDSFLYFIFLHIFNNTLINKFLSKQKDNYFDEIPLFLMISNTQINTQ